jgi:hypothetical protein
MLSSMGLRNISYQKPIDTSDEIDISHWREGSKKSVQQGRSPFDSRSVLPVREHGKLARMPLVVIFKIPSMVPSGIKKRHNGTLELTHNRFDGYGHKSYQGTKDLASL